MTVPFGPDWTWADRPGGRRFDLDRKLGHEVVPAVNPDGSSRFVRSNGTSGMGKIHLVQGAAWNAIVLPGSLCGRTDAYCRGGMSVVEVFDVFDPAWLEGRWPEWCGRCPTPQEVARRRDPLGLA